MTLSKPLSTVTSETKTTKSNIKQKLLKLSGFRTIACILKITSTNPNHLFKDQGDIFFKINQRQIKNEKGISFQK